MLTSDLLLLVLSKFSLGGEREACFDKISEVEAGRLRSTFTPFLIHMECVIFK